jgi:hypothetical protein
VFHGRALIWLGVAQNALGSKQAQATLRESLEKEIHFGGRDAWLCYYALGRATPAESRDYFQQARNIIQAISASLYSRPQLQAIIQNDPIVRWLIETPGDAN